MQSLTFSHEATRRAGGRRQAAIVGVVASGNLEALFERVLEGAACEVTIATPVKGFDHVWAAVIEDYVARASPGGLRISINDGGARPDAVFLRLLQGSAMMEAT